jgi:glutaredoxin
MVVKFEALKFQALVSAALLLVALPVAAQYRWVDENGRVNYGDTPPDGARNLKQVDGRTRGADDPNAALPFELRRAMSQYPVTLYTAESCPPCEAARVYLRRRGVPYREFVLETDEEAQELRRRVGVDSVPVMTLGRSPSIGFNEVAWNTALNAAGYPETPSLPATHRDPAPQPLLPRAAGPANQVSSAGPGAQPPVR